MDSEHSFDSDTSESWCIIGVIDNEHSNILELSDSFPSNTILAADQLSTNNTIAAENGAIDLHSQQTGNTVQNKSTANCSSNSLNTASSSVSEHPKVQQDCQVLYKGKVFQNDYNLGRKLSDFNCSKDSFSEAEKGEIDTKLKDFDNDTDGISIISESECNELKCSAYETDEILDEKLSGGNLLRKIHPNALKRKRKRLKLYYRESSEESVSSDFMVPDGKYYSNIEDIQYKKSNNEMQVTEFPSAPVYRHYRNNVANTVLTLAMGVIFTGVACIAIGHFLGVHDAQHTAGEMMETLKKLQMENVLLHTRLAQLSRAFFGRGSSKLEFRANVEPQNCLDKFLVKNIHSGKKNNLNDVSPIKNSIFFRGGSFDISTNLKEPANELNYKESQNYENIKVSIENHDQSDFVNISKYEEEYSKPLYSSTTPHHGYNDFVPWESNLQNKGEKIAPDGQTAQRKIWKYSDEKRDYSGMDEQFENGRDKEDCLAVREKDLSRFRWFILQKKKKRKNARLNAGNSGYENVDAVYSYNFPQPEEFYKCEIEDENNKKRSVEKLKLNEMCDELNLVCHSRDKDTSDGKKFSEKGARKDDILGGQNYFSKTGKERKEIENDFDDSKNSESLKKDGRFQKKNGKPLRKIKDDEDNFSKGSKKYKNESSKKYGKMKECRKKGNRECNFKPHLKKSKDLTYSKEKIRDGGRKNGRDKEKYLKGEKVKKVKLEKETSHRVYNMPKNFREKTSLDTRSTNHSDCDSFSNKTAKMLYKRAKGREKCRMDEKISEWQFFRAKSRAGSRIGDSSWQFSRAVGRESSRNEDYVHFRKRDIKHKRFFSDEYWI